MGKIEFDEYLKEKRVDTNSKTPIDWIKEKEEWLNYLDNFYQQVEGFLNEYTKSDDVSFAYAEKNIYEDSIGQYPVKSLQIQIKNKIVFFDPVGTTLIGAKGRIDMTSDAGVVKFVLVDKNLSGPRKTVILREEGEQNENSTEERHNQIEWTWKIATPPPRISYIEITADSFFDALMEVING